MCYLTVSCFVTLIDFTFTILLKHLGLNMILSNTIGMIMGTLTQFFILYKYVYNLPLSKREFIKFESSFLVGLCISNQIVWTSYHVFKLSPYVSKIISILLTFIILYVIREIMVKQVIDT